MCRKSKIDWRLAIACNRLLDFTSAPNYYPKLIEMNIRNLIITLCSISTWAALYGPLAANSAELGTQALGYSIAIPMNSWDGEIQTDRGVDICPSLGYTTNNTYSDSTFVPDPGDGLMIQTVGGDIRQLVKCPGTLTTVYKGVYEGTPDLVERTANHMRFTCKQNVQIALTFGLRGEFGQPGSSAGCFCKRGNPPFWDWDAELQRCVFDNPPLDPPPPPICKRDAGLSTPNSILPATGEKYFSESDFQDLGPNPLSFTRTYRSNWAIYKRPAAVRFGKVWSHSHQSTLQFSLTGTKSTLYKSDGSTRTFARSSILDPWVADSSVDQLIKVGQNWSYKNSEDDSSLIFDANGRLQARTERNGWSTLYSYDSDGFLMAVSNSFGRTLTFEYAGGNLVAVTTPDGRVFNYNYNAQGYLSSVVYPDGKKREFLYETADFGFVTGILDEEGNRWGTFRYDNSGRAVLSELAGGVSKYSVSYEGLFGLIAVKDPIGTTRAFRYATNSGKMAVVFASDPSNDGDDVAQQRVQDLNGLVSSKTDFNSSVTEMSWNESRRLEISVSEAVGTPQERSKNFEWHPTYALPTLITEEGRTTAYTYDVSGNALSKTVTDLASNKSQVWHWSWNAQQLLETEQDPRGGVSSFEYDLRGNLIKQTNRMGHITTFDFDTANRITSMISPNNVVTSYAYDARSRITGETVDSVQIQTLTYTAFNKIKTITSVSGLITNFEYDTAHRLIGWNNNRGESESFTLDAMGNTVEKRLFNAQNSLSLNTFYDFDMVNRLINTTGIGH